MHVKAFVFPAQHFRYFEIPERKKELRQLVSVVSAEATEICRKREFIVYVVGLIKTILSIFTKHDVRDAANRAR